MSTVTVIIDNQEVEIQSYALQKAKNILGAVEKE